MSSHFGSDLQIPIPDLVTRCNQSDVSRLPAQSILSLDQLHTFFYMYKSTRNDKRHRLFFVILYSFFTYTPEFLQLFNYLFIYV